MPEPVVTVEELRNRIGDVRERITKAGGDPDRVEIVPVTKTFDAAVVRLVLEAGLAELGENYAQELVAKDALLTDVEPHWHFMGQLQRNKVSKLAPIVSLWQTVDSPALAQSIARHSPGAAVLLQVNLSGADNRGGVSWSELDALHESAVEEGLEVRGLMGVAPMAEDGANKRSIRSAFKKLATAAEKLSLPEVSMGMSADFEIAVEEGSTMIRLGTVLLGDRPRRD